MLSASSSEVQGEVPGLQSVATAIGTPAARSSATGGGVRLAQREVGARQQNRDRARLASWRTHAVLAQILEMVGGQRAVTRRQFGGAHDRSTVPHAGARATACARGAQELLGLRGEKAMFSQNASTASTSPSAASALEPWSADQVDEVRGDVR